MTVVPTPSIVAPAPGETADSQLVVRGLTKHFPIRQGVFSRTSGWVKAVDGISFAIARGETFGLVGESGSGKTTTGRCILRLVGSTSGRIEFEGTNLLELSGEEMRPMRQHLQIVFQDPYSSLNPRMRVGSIVEEPLIIHRSMTRSERRSEVESLLGKVGLEPAAYDRYPHEFSGGQRQRVGIARALATNPKFLVLDEPVSALDVSIQAQVINLLRDLQDELGLTYLFIAHDLAVVEHISTNVGVMYLGRMMEIASREALYETPLHPYTRALLSAVPVPDPTAQRSRVVLHGDIPTPIDPPSGCVFHTRCPIAEPRCAVETPPLVEHEAGHWAACHLVDAPASD